MQPVCHVECLLQLTNKNTYNGYVSALQDAKRALQGLMGLGEDGLGQDLNESRFIKAQKEVIARDKCASNLRLVHC